MIATQPKNIGGLDDRESLLGIDTIGMQAIQMMYKDKASEVLDRLAKMDSSVREVMLHAIKGAHIAMSQTNPMAVPNAITV